MGSVVTIEVKGVDKLTKRLESLKKLQKAVMPAINQGVGMVEAQAKALAPVAKENGGTLRGSIKPHAATVQGGTITGRVSANTDYALYVEFGTGIRGAASGHPKSKPGWYASYWAGMTAQPYLYPALKINKPKIVRLIEAAVEAEVKKDV